MKRSRAFVDAVEAGVARLLTQDGKRTFTLPAAFLPRACGEGAWVQITIEPATDLPPARAQTARKKGPRTRPRSSRSRQ
jgi:hypothetical protein